MSSKIISKRITSLIMLIVGLIVLLDYFIENPGLAAVSLFLMKLAAILVAFSLGVAAVGIFRLHVPIVLKRVKGEWYFSAWMLFILTLTALIGVFGGVDHPAFQWLYSNIYLPLSSTMFAMLGFFIISAAYRAFRARGLDATVLLLTGVLVMLMNMPLGGAIWSGFPIIGTWLRDIPAMAGYRGVTLALTIGLVAYSIRVIIGYEKPMGG
jgi:hypothetical protein